MWAIVRAILFGAICAIAVAIAAALRVPAATPEGRVDIAPQWIAPVPQGWPEHPWSEAREDRSWGRTTIEFRGDPPFTGGRRGEGFSAQWVLQTGWPLPALQCVRSRLRTLWDQGVASRSPVEGPSEHWSEGIRVPATALGGDDGFMLMPIAPLWWGLAIDSLFWAVPIFLIGVASRRISAARKATRRRARESAMAAAPPDRSSG